MSAAWFHVPSLSDSGIVWIPKDEAKHALGARRLGPGDAVTLFDGAGHVGTERNRGRRWLQIAVDGQAHHERHVDGVQGQGEEVEPIREQRPEE